MYYTCFYYITISAFHIDYNLGPLISNYMCSISKTIHWTEEHMAKVHFNFKFNYRGSKVIFVVEENRINRNCIVAGLHNFLLVVEGDRWERQQASGSWGCNLQHKFEWTLCWIHCKIFWLYHHAKMWKC